MWGLNRGGSRNCLNGFLRIDLFDIAACMISRKIRTMKRGKYTSGTDEHTFFSIALVRSSLDTPSLLSLRTDAIIRDAVFDATKTRAGIVAFLAGVLAVRAGVLDLATF